MMAASRSRMSGEDEGEDDHRSGNFSAAAVSSPMRPKELFRDEQSGQTNCKLGDGEKNEVGDCNDDSSTSSASSSDGDESVVDGSSSDADEGDDNDSDSDGGNDGLSDYERLRLRNIKRNEARLAQLGLLTKTSNDNTNSRSGTRGSSNACTTTSALTNLLLSNDGQTSQRRKKRQSSESSAAIVPRRSLPRRRCRRSAPAALGGEGAGGEGSAGGESLGFAAEGEGHSSDNESSPPASPIEIRRVLLPQPHQLAKLSDEESLKQYLRTRRVRRGRPRREEYEYRCDERCEVCGGEWLFDGNDDGDGDEGDAMGGGGNTGEVGEGESDLEERTRLIRCKDCRGAFHLGCMMIHGKDEESDGSGKKKMEGGEDDVEDDRKPAAVAAASSVADDSSELDAAAADPKRCHRCHVRYKLRKQSSSSSSSLLGSVPLLEATIDDNRTVRVRVFPEPTLDAVVNGREITCCVSLGGQTNHGTDGEGPKKKKRSVSWRRPLEEGNEETTVDATTLQIQKLIDKAVNDPDNSRLQDSSCAAIRKHLSTEESTTSVVNLGGLQMLTNAMRLHPDRPIIQAEALCTLAEITWVCPQYGIDTINANGVELAVSAMESNAVHSKVQQMGCSYFRSLSYDSECCGRLMKSRAVEVVAEGVRRNMRKVNVLMEGAGFLQNMLVVSQSSTLKSILHTKRNDIYPAVLPTLLTAMQTNPTKNNVDLLFAVFGLLSNVALDAKKGRVALRELEVSALAMEVVRDHSDVTELCVVALGLKELLDKED